MPWQEESVMCQRQRLIEQLLLPNANVSQICKQFNISRKTAYKWLKRYRTEGIEALQDVSRKPHCQPCKITAKMESVILDTHQTYPYWGPRKLRDYLLHVRGMKNIPAHTTFSRVLKRHNCCVINNMKSAPAKIRFERDTPNALWQMDFKGSFMTTVERCYPLTILDDYSRYSIGLKACRNEQSATVQSSLTAIFQDFGLPTQINVDNGNPWGAADLNSLTSLQVWLFKLGIRLSHSAPYHPQTNGKDERFHRTLKLEVLHNNVYQDCQKIQKAFNQWRDIYNYQRPHEALGGLPPSSRYQVSTRKFPTTLPQAEYESGTIVRRVDETSGLFSFKGNKYRAGKGLGGEYIALRETQYLDEFAIFFLDQFIKKIKLHRAI